MRRMHDFVRWESNTFVLDARRTSEYGRTIRTVEGLAVSDKNLFNPKGIPRATWNAVWILCPWLPNVTLWFG